MTSSDYQRTISFNLGEAFPDTKPVAAFVVALSLAWKDLLYVNMRLVGDDADAPAKPEVSDGEMRYLVGVAFAHLQEMRTCISQARLKWPEVAGFLDGRSAEAQQDLRLVLDLDTADNAWIERALHYLRNQLFHYGGKTNWQDVRWAMRAVKDEEGVVSKANDTYAGTRLDFAELIWVQHLTRKFPAAEPDADDVARQELEELQMRARASPDDCDQRRHSVRHGRSRRLPQRPARRRCGLGVVTATTGRVALGWSRWAPRDHMAAIAPRRYGTVEFATGASPTAARGVE